jgi:hypothetical protein
MKRRLVAFLRPRFDARCMASVSSPFTARAYTRVSSFRRIARHPFSANHTEARLAKSDTSFGGVPRLTAYIGAFSDFTWYHATIRGESRYRLCSCCLYSVQSPTVSLKNSLSAWQHLQAFRRARSPQSAFTLPTRSRKSTRTSMAVSQSKHRTNKPSERQSCAQSRIDLSLGTWDDAFMAASTTLATLCQTRTASAKTSLRHFKN